MSEPTYSIALSETERTALAKVLGALVTKLINAPLQLNAPLDPKSGTDQARAILSPPSSPAPPAVAQPTAPIAVRDRWARDRKGNEVPNPSGCEAMNVHLWKIEKKPARKAGGQPFWKVTWQVPNSNGYGDANCFDEPVALAIITQQGKLTTLYTVRSGQYLNVVGVRA